MSRDLLLDQLRADIDKMLNDINGLEFAIDMMIGCGLTLMVVAVLLFLVWRR